MTGGETDFEGANELGFVIGVNAGSGGWVEASEHFMQPACALVVAGLLKAIAQCLLARRPGEKAHGERAEIEAGASGDDGEVIAAGDLVEGDAGLAAVFAGGKNLARIGDVDQVMRQDALLFAGGLGGAYVHAAVDGDRVAADDFCRERLAKREGEGGLAAAGGAENENG